MFCDGLPERARGPCDYYSSVCHRKLLLLIRIHKNLVAYNRPMELEGQNLSVYSVAEVNALARTLLESKFPDIWIEGEISSFKPYRSGHWYFSLKDEEAEIRCVMFRRDNLAVQFEPRDGARVRLRCRISLYEQRGGFQAIGRDMQPAGAGELLAALAALRERLSAEGLFDASKKRDLPSFPRHLALITSPSGAALRDIARTIRLRQPLFECTLLPVSVQGANAAPEIVRAFERLGQWPDHLGGARPDVVVLARGGGSLEDLWAFNLEAVVRAVAHCPIPIVTGIGHETDTTLSDLVADHRAATPTAAATTATPDGRQLLQRAREADRQLGSRLGAHIAYLTKDRLQQWIERLQARHPERILRSAMQRGDEYEERLHNAMNRLEFARGNRHAELIRRLTRLDPRPHIQAQLKKLADLGSRLAGAQARALRASLAWHQALASRLSALSPQGTLDRGYAILSRHEEGTRFGHVITRVDQASLGDRLHAHLADGELHVSVTSSAKTQGTTS